MLQNAPRFKLWWPRTTAYYKQGPRPLTHSNNSNSSRSLPMNLIISATIVSQLICVFLETRLCVSNPESVHFYPTWLILLLFQNNSYVALRSPGTLDPGAKSAKPARQEPLWKALYQVLTRESRLPRALLVGCHTFRHNY